MYITTYLRKALHEFAAARQMKQLTVIGESMA